MRREFQQAMLSTLAFAGFATADPPDEQTLRWIEQVLLGHEFGAAKARVVRWAQPQVTVSVFGSHPEGKAEVAKAVNALSQALAGSGPRLVMENDRTPWANIQIYFAPKAGLPALAARHQLKAPPDDLGFFWLRWDNRNVITRAYVFLASDKLTGRGLRHFALEEIAQSLGLAGDSPEFADSIFFQHDKDGGQAQQLSPLDVRLIRWLHARGRPGDDAAALRERLRAGW